MNASDSPRTVYRAAFLGAIALAFAGIFIYANREAIDGPLLQPTAIAAPSCQLTQEGQVAHITVRLAGGHLVAQCRIVTGRKS
jgi:hypothetical protein